MGPFEKMLMEQCAPTLAGMKPASLFRMRGMEQVRVAAEHWDRQLEPLGIRVIVLKEYPEADAGVVYVCRWDWMGRILRDEDNRAFLRGMGYADLCLEAALDHLRRRLGNGGEYPHEIGVFLGYPLHDVKGFIENRGKNYTYCGCWKCYGDPTAARECFDCYQACTDAYKRMYAQGVPMMNLVVAA